MFHSLQKPGQVCRQSISYRFHTDFIQIFEYLYNNHFNNKYVNYTMCTVIQEILRNGFDKLDGVGVTHLDLAAHGTVSLSRCSTMRPTSGSVHSLPSTAMAPGLGSCAVRILNQLRGNKLWLHQSQALFSCTILRNKSSPQQWNKVFWNFSLYF